MESTSVMVYEAKRLEFAVEDIFKPLKFLHHQDPQGEGVAKIVISKSSETRSSSVQEAS